jgi:hypothetical protein
MMSRRIAIIACILLCLPMAASAQTASPEAMKAARSLVATMNLAEQYKALLPAILLRIRPVVTQERAELESEYDALTKTIKDAYTPFLNEMLEGAATIFASNFTADEIHQMDAFYRLPAGQKLLEKSAMIAQQTAQIGQDVSRKAAEDLRLRIVEALRQRGHKL